MNFKDHPKYHTISTKLDHKLYIQLIRFINGSNETKSEIARRALEQFLKENL